MKRLLSLSLLALAVSACSGPPGKSDPVSLDPADGVYCALDGMILAEHPGPKGQIRYADGSVDYYCDTVELVSTLLQPEQARSISGAYVQDMAQADWSKPKGHWIDAKTAFYVEGAKLHGSMGPTFATFAQRADADRFASQQGGKVHAFNDITPQMVKLDGGVMHDHNM